MAIPHVYPNFILAVHNKEVDWSGDTWHLVLLDDSYTPDYTNDAYWDDISAHEITGTGYTTGGITVASPTITYNAGTNTVTLNLADAAWTSSTFSAYHAVLVDWTPATDATRPLALHIDFEGAMEPADGSLSISWNASGVVVYNL